MASLHHHLLLLLAVLCLAAAPPARAGDPDILTDFVVPADVNATALNATFFTFSSLVQGMNSGDMTKFTVSKASMAEFPALTGQSVSYAGLMFPAGSVNPPHIHPRASELLYLAAGELFVGVIDTANNLYNQTLRAGDMFVFPKGLVHFQYNSGAEMARAFSAFGSASPGTIPLPTTLFGSGIDDAVLAKSLHTDNATVDSLKGDNAVPPPAPAPAPKSSDAAISALLSPAVLLFCLGVFFL